MSDPSSDITPGELSRRMQDVLSRFTALVAQIEERYVRKDILDLYKEGIDAQVKGIEASIKGIRESLVEKATYTAEKLALEKRVAELEDSNKWLFRLVVGFVILTVLGAVFVASGGGGGSG